MSRPAPSVIGYGTKRLLIDALYLRRHKNDHSTMRHTVGSAAVGGPDKDAGAMTETLALSTLPSRLQTHSSSVICHDWRACSHLQSNGHPNSYPIPPCVKESHHHPMMAALRATGRLQWNSRPSSAPPAQRRPPQRRLPQCRQLTAPTAQATVPRR